MTTTATVAMDTITMAAAPVPHPNLTLFVDMGSLNGTFLPLPYSLRQSMTAAT